MAPPDAVAAPDRERPPVRVLRIIARLNVGGPAIHTALLNHGMDDGVAFRSLLAAGPVGPSEGDMSYYARSLGVEPRMIPELGRELSWRDDLTAFRKLVTLMREFRPHIVHTHTAKAGAVGRFAAIVAGVPIRIHTFHGNVFKGYFGPLKTWVFLAIERVLARFSDRIVAISELQKAELCDEYRIAPRARCAVIPLGFDLARFAAAERRRGELRRELNVPEGRKLIGIVGRLVPIKNHAMFLDAAKRIVEHGADAAFVIAGDGELRAALEQQARDLGVADRVHFLGWRRDLDVLYADLDVVALSSNNEGTPVTVIEAMAAARPVVATRVGGVADVVDDGASGLLVESGDAAGFAAATLRLLGDPALAARLGQAARQRALGRYGSERLVNDVRSLYLELLSAKRLPVPAAPEPPAVESAAAVDAARS